MGQHVVVLKSYGSTCSCAEELWVNMYRIAQNGGGGKLWRIWRIQSNSPKFYPPKFISKFWVDHDYREKFHPAKTCSMSILKYFHPVKQKPDLPDPSGPLSQTVPPTAIAAANIKVTEALNEAEVRQSASRSRGTYSFLTPAQKYKVGKRAAEHGVTATIRY